MNYKTKIGLVVRLTPKRRQHIVFTHPIMELYLNKIKQVLNSPDEIRYSNYRYSVLLFYRYFDKIEDGKYIAVVIDQLNKTVLTAYLTNRIKIGAKYEEKKKFQA